MTTFAARPTDTSSLPDVFVDPITGKVRDFVPVDSFGPAPRFLPEDRVEVDDDPWDDDGWRVGQDRYERYGLGWDR